MRRLITVHGLNTRGDWQEEVEAVLDPFCECISIKYRHYRRLGVTKLVVEPWVFFPVLAAGIGLWWWGVLAALPVLILIILDLLVAHIASHLRRHRARKTVKEQLTLHMRYGQRPHIIAHSLGTYLVGSILEKFDDPRATDIILTGCVLKRGWDWRGLKKRNRFSFQRVRNEVAMKDWTARLAYLLEGLIPGFGMAGFAGFYKRVGFIHTVDSGNLPCADCVPPDRVVPIHNVRSRECGHSDVFIGVGYATAFWLPYLWGIDPPEYQEFLGMCLKAAELDDAKDYVKLKVVELELREAEWVWCEGPFALYVQRVVLEHPRLGGSSVSVAKIVDFAVRGVWRVVAAASEAAQNDVRVREKVRALNPPTAVTEAVDVALR